MYAHLASAFTAGLSLASILLLLLLPRGSRVLQCLYEGQRTTLWVLGLTLVTWLAGQLKNPKGVCSFLFLFLKHAGTLNTSSKDKDL